MSINDILRAGIYLIPIWFIYIANFFVLIAYDRVLFPKNEMAAQLFYTQTLILVDNWQKIIIIVKINTTLTLNPLSANPKKWSNTLK